MADAVGPEFAVRFALVETREKRQQSTAVIELWLSGGDRLQITPRVEAATLRTVLAVLQEAGDFICQRVCAFICARRRAICAAALTGCTHC